MKAWLLGPIGSKVIGGLLILAGLAFSYRYFTNRAWHQGQRDGEIYGAAELTKKKEAEWKAKDEEFKHRETELASQEAQAAEFRASMRADYKRSIDSLRKDFSINQRNNALIPADQLDPAIIARLESLRTK